MGGRHIFGDVVKVGLGANFKKIRANDYFYIDKTPFIEHFLGDTVEVSLICRPRRFGKSLNMDALRCFLTDSEDNRELFGGLAVESSGAWAKVGSAPVFYFDFKGLAAESYKYTVFSMVRRYLRQYCQLISDPDLRERVDEYFDERPDEEAALRLLTEVAHEVTGKKSYILIDEYDKLLLDEARAGSYAEIRKFMTYLFSAAFKDNPFLEKGLLTGVMRISYEGLFSGLNNIKVFDVFSDSRYSEDFGATEGEMQELAQLCPINLEGARYWYNGFSIGGIKLYNIFSVSNYLIDRKFAAYWGKSGTMELVAGAADRGRLGTLAKIVAGEREIVPVASLSSLGQIETSDAAFYSLLIQAGYLAIADSASGEAEVCAPNQEMRIIWTQFIFAAAMPNIDRPVIDLFRRGDPAAFSAALEQIMADTLSFWDLRAGEHEYAYHIFLLGGLAFSDSVLDKSRTKSNREAGDGRYDIWMERGGRNYIFELKACASGAELEGKAELALRQIDEKRYGAELDRGKPFWKVGIACFGKQCKVKCVAEGGAGS
jgi:hypothetical protein